MMEMSIATAPSAPVTETQQMPSSSNKPRDSPPPSYTSLTNQNFVEVDIEEEDDSHVKEKEVLKEKKRLRRNVFNLFVLFAMLLFVMFSLIVYMMIKIHNPSLDIRMMMVEKNNHDLKIDLKTRLKVLESNSFVNSKRILQEFFDAASQEVSSRYNRDWEINQKLLQHRHTIETLLPGCGVDIDGFKWHGSQKYIKAVKDCLSKWRL